MRSVPELMVLVPMKPLATAKSRLMPGISDNVRKAVVFLMLERVVASAAEALGPGACRVVGGDEDVWSVAEEAGGDWGSEEGDDLNSSLWLAAQGAFSEGVRAVLYLPADLPQATADDVHAVAAASDALTKPVGVRAQADGGTNALLLPAACAFEPLLGEDSFARHQAAALSRGTPLVVADAPGLAFDVDSSDDLAWAKENVPGFSERLTFWQFQVARMRAPMGIPGEGSPIEGRNAGG